MASGYKLPETALFVFEKGLLTNMKHRLSAWCNLHATFGHLCFIHRQPSITDISLGLGYHLPHVPNCISVLGRCDRPLVLYLLVSVWFLGWPLWYQCVKGAGILPWVQIFVFQFLMGIGIEGKIAEAPSSIDYGLLDVDSDNNQVEKSLKGYPDPPNNNNSNNNVPLTKSISDSRMH